MLVVFTWTDLLMDSIADSLCCTTKCAFQFGLLIGEVAEEQRLKDIPVSLRVSPQAQKLSFGSVQLATNVIVATFCSIVRGGLF